MTSVVGAGDCPKYALAMRCSGPVAFGKSVATSDACPYVRVRSGHAATYETNRPVPKPAR
jgi:hypothetical protein